ncbi:hypothetical protein J7E63_25025 [Bacillus sp. ISL-75]|uniref:hypothetical protein n=1 Tax=Bacillus sp. ISL-75 TaxID=2819137 RepID=UPI001BE796A5|nr:hypothetical protein [Bacillus sp. ISL-75]MBT2730125.1 hypothetical protein [Bacillus sp. ISL-75]
MLKNKFIITNFTDFGNVEVENYIRGDEVMGIFLSIFYGFVGLIVLFVIIAYSVSIGIDNSKQVKALRSELKEIKNQLKEFSGK